MVQILETALDDVSNVGSHRTKVLLVEDEVLISELVSEALTDHGFEVCTAMTASAAMDTLMHDDDIDVLFTDINLPGDMDGAELARRVREIRPDMPIVYASGRHNALSIAPLVPRSLFVCKPYRPDEVCVLIEHLSAH